MHPRRLRRHHPQQNEDEGATATTSRRQRQRHDHATTRLRRPHLSRPTFHMQRSLRLALIVSSPTTSLRTLAGRRRQRFALSFHMTTVPHPCLALTIRPSTHDDDGASPSRRPHLPRHTHAYGKCHTNIHSLDSPSPRQFAHTRARARWLPRLLCTRAHVYAPIAITRVLMPPRPLLPVPFRRSRPPSAAHRPSLSLLFYLAFSSSSRRLAHPGTYAPSLTLGLALSCPSCCLPFACGRT